MTFIDYLHLDEKERLKLVADVRRYNAKIQLISQTRKECLELEKEMKKKYCLTEKP